MKFIAIAKVIPIVVHPTSVFKLSNSHKFQLNISPKTLYIKFIVSVTNVSEKPRPHPRKFTPWILQ